MNVKEMFLGGWATALIVLVAVCSLGNEPFGVLPFLGVLAVVMIFTCGVLLQMMSSLEVYAIDCYNKTTDHEYAIKALGTIDEVEGYDFRKGYPDKLIFKL